MNELKKFDGWLIIDKPIGLTSTQVGNKIKKALNVKKIGHAGTLDPFASGILPLAIGEATKTAQFLQHTYKTYEFTLEFGKATDTADCDGKIIAESKIMPTKKQITAILPYFIGEITQTPPKYSAIKINGKRAYKMARKGEDFIIPKRQITIYDLKCNSFLNNVATFTVKCSSGTYVRTLGEDIAKKVGTIGYLSQLKRTSVGIFSLKNAISLEDAIKKGYIYCYSNLLCVSAVLDDIPAVTVSHEDAQRLVMGQRLPFDHKDQDVLVVRSQNNVIAIASVLSGILKPKRVFNF